MFDVGWTEILIIAIVLIVVVGPKDLPQMLRQFGRATSKFRAMAGDFRKQFDEAMKEADLDEVRNLASDVRKFDPRSTISKHLSPLEKAGQEIKAGLDATTKPKPDTSAEPAAPVTHAAEPVKAAATEVAATAAGTAKNADAAKPRAASKRKAPARKAKPQAAASTNGTGTAPAAKTPARKVTAKKPAVAAAAAEKAKPASRKKAGAT